MTMEAEISSKNTKAQIFSAYEKVLKELQNAKQDVPKTVQKEKKKVAVLEKVENTSHDGIIQGIGSLKIGLNSSLDQLERKLVDEFKSLENIRAAILEEKQNLEDLYSLTANTDSLAAMLLAHKEIKESFEEKSAEEKFAFNEKMKAEKIAFSEKMGQDGLEFTEKMNTEKDAFQSEMKTAKEQWKLEKAKQLVEEKDYVEQLAKKRSREEEEYLYNSKIVRKKEADAYDAKKAKQEKDLAEKKSVFDDEIAKREENVANAETELATLRKENVEFPKKLEKALANKEREITAKLEANFDFERKLTAKQSEGEINLKAQAIVSLQDKIEEMQQRIKELSEKANVAETNVKDIAVKAIESSSKIHVFPKKENIED